MAKGWKGESKRHDLSRQGIKTAQKVKFIPSERQRRLEERKKVTDKIKKMGNSDTLPFTETKIKTFHLPIETATYIPITGENQNEISDSEFRERILSAEKYLAGIFGGFSTVEMSGGYTLVNGKLVEEKVAKIIVFTTDESLTKHQDELKKWLLKKGKQWNQESMGFEVEGDLYYVSEK